MAAVSHGYTIKTRTGRLSSFGNLKPHLDAKVNSKAGKIGQKRVVKSKKKVRNRFLVKT